MCSKKYGLDKDNVFIRDKRNDRLPQKKISRVHQLEVKK